MTNTPIPPPPDPASASGKVSDLEKQLADAAAKLAQVQAELSQARAADPNHPQVPVPYAGNAPVVMINGQQVQAGQTIDLSAMLGGLFGGAGAAGAAGAAAGQVVNIPPVVSVNGQVVSGGQPVDLSSILGAEGAAQVRSSLEQLGLGGQFGGLFGGTSSPMPADNAFAQPGPAQALRYSSTPGEIPSGGNKALAWLAAVLVVGLIGVIAYLLISN
jgi:hypothetical protein